MKWNEIKLNLEILELRDEVAADAKYSKKLKILKLVATSIREYAGSEMFY